MRCSTSTTVVTVPHQVVLCELTAANTDRHGKVTPDFIACCRAECQAPGMGRGYSRPSWPISPSACTSEQENWSLIRDPPCDGKQSDDVEKITNDPTG